MYARTEGLLLLLSFVAAAAYRVCRFCCYSCFPFHSSSSSSSSYLKGGYYDPLSSTDPSIATTIISGVKVRGRGQGGGTQGDNEGFPTLSPLVSNSPPPNRSPDSSDAIYFFVCFTPLPPVLVPLLHLPPSLIHTLLLSWSLTFSLYSSSGEEPWRWRVCG